ncbi:DUF5994 family protein [Nocardia sp. NPDC051750]|uniref:DUF5994 family protein n=1 Tax=Nocardia sp. NPDC051750 TaxID=3364325 RepID=UPI003790E2A8
MTSLNEQAQLGGSARVSLRSGPPPESRRLPTPRAPRPGAIDGAWWPRTDDLVTELAELEALQSGRMGVVDRIMYNMDAWRPAPRRTAVGGRSVRLDGYRHLPAHTLCFLGLDRTRLVLLVIPARADEATAWALLAAASRPGNELTAGELIAADSRHRRERTENAAALRRWDDEGGHDDQPSRPVILGPIPGNARSLI